MFREPTLEELIWTAVSMLTGVQGKDWEPMETDLNWWALRLYTRRN